MTAIAIIGHGPSAEGKGWGPAIDALPVVRMHDWRWQPLADYGRRLTYITLPGPWGRRALRETVDAPLNGFLLYQHPTTRQYEPDWFRGKPVYSFPMKAICAPLIRAGYVPTRGLAGILMAIEVAKPTAVVLVGCDNVVNGVIDSYAPSCPAERTPQDDGNEVDDQSRHHMGLERALLLERLKARGVELIVAGQGWPEGDRVQ